MFGLDYDRLKRRTERMEQLRDRYLISFADLFVLLAFVFMFLYVISAVQAGLMTIAQNYQAAQQRRQYQQRLDETIRAYEQRLHAYEIEKEEYIRKHGTAREVAVYEEVLGKLYLLRQEALEKNREHLEAARRYDERQRELDKYQHLIADIAKANLVAKSQLLKENVEKQKTEKKLEVAQATFDERLQKASAEHKKRLEKEYARALEAEREALRREKVHLRDDYKEQVASIKEDYRKRLQAVDRTNKEKLEEIKAQYKAEIARSQEKYKKKVASISEELTAVNAELKDAVAEREKLRKENARALASVDKLKGDLEREKERQARLREGIAGKLKEAFEKAGVAAEVDARTGEVTISFAEVYFDYDSAELKPEMKEAIRKVVPVYANTLLSDAAIREHIASLEVVGFASPTYLGKYVAPGRLDWTGQRGVNYNMDLSYRRAKSIFQFIFDREQLKFGHQASMLKLTKVSGVSYLKSEPPRKPAAEASRAPGAKDFCSQYDCAAWQKVIIKFNLKEGP